MSINNHYLNKVVLSGYKSIIDVDVNFKEGLNIIIGKNAAGKTNLLKFLYNVLDFSFDNILDFSSELSFDGSSKIVIKSNRDILEDNSINSTRISKSKVNTTVFVDGETINIDDLSIGGFDDLFKKNEASIIPTFVRHGIPKDYYLVDSSFSFKIDKSGVPFELFSKVTDPNTPYFIKNLLAELSFLSLGYKNISIADIRSTIINDLKEVEKIKYLLNKFSPIEDIRFNENINIFHDKDAGGYTVNNLFLEFKIQGSWYPFDSLSDGTKRLFYIISEVGYTGKLNFSNNGFGTSSSNSNRIILIEEPELGVHPHQLMALMEFLKIESKHKQIIVTSHSPIIVDVLEANELDRIIIASIKSKKEGTKLRHLDELEISKAKLYLEEDYLSDYWKYSDLEKK